MNRKQPSRRTVVKHLVAGGIMTSGAVAVAQTKPAATTSTSLPTTAPSGLATADVEALDRVLGHEHTVEERQMMRGGLASKREAIRSLRKRTIPPDLEPAIRFDPRLPDTKVPQGPSSFRSEEGRGGRG